MRAIFFIFIIFIFIDLNAQVEDLNAQKNIFFQDEASFGLTFKTNGWGMDFRRGYYVNYKQKNLWEIGFNKIKHPKEHKRPSYNSLFQGYVYGKLNEVYDFNFGIGRQFTLVQKKEVGTVEIRIIPMIGAQFSLLKPIYYEIIVSTTPFIKTKDEKYNVSHQPGLINGKAAFWKGIDEISFDPGIYFKLGTSFEHSKNVNAVKSLELGFQISFYLKELEMMAETDNYRIITCLYLNYRIGGLMKNKSKKNPDNL